MTTPRETSLLRRHNSWAVLAVVPEFTCFANEPHCLLPFALSSYERSVIVIVESLVGVEMLYVVDREWALRSRARVANLRVRQWLLSCCLLLGRLWICLSILVSCRRGPVVRLIDEIWLAAAYRNHHSVQGQLCPFERLCRSWIARAMTFRPLWVELAPHDSGSVLRVFLHENREQAFANEPVFVLRDLFFLKRWSLRCELQRLSLWRYGYFHESIVWWVPTAPQLQDLALLLCHSSLKRLTMAFCELKFVPTFLIFCLLAKFLIWWKVFIVGQLTLRSRNRDRRVKRRDFSHAAWIVSPAI